MSDIIYIKEFVNFISNKYQDLNPIESKKTSKELSNENLWNDMGILKFEIDKSFHDEDTFVKNYGNPLYRVHRSYASIKIESIGDKVSFKLFYGYKERAVGKPYFKMSKNVEFLTVNKRTGDVYSGYIRDYQKKRKYTKKIRKNYFACLPLNQHLVKIKNVLNGHMDNPSAIIFESSKIFLDSICHVTPDLGYEKVLMKFYLDKKGFKYPNNFWLYSEFLWLPTFKKNLKKSKNLVDALLKTYDLKGKKLKKYIHEAERLNISAYCSIERAFGINYLTQDNDFIKNVLESKVSLTIPNEIPILASKSELKKIYSVLKNTILFDTINNWTFCDHLRMYVELKMYGDTEVEWTSDGSDWAAFHNEHLNWSDKLQYYKRGDYIRIYPKYFHDVIEQPIEGYYPKILCTSDDYNSESNVQNNCVKGYIGKCYSMIISLRKGHSESEERATIEYKITKFSDKISSKPIQSLGKYNNQLSEEWKEVLLKLNEKVLSCFLSKDFEPVKLKKTCLNGTVLESDSEFNELGLLSWTYKAIGD